MKTTGIITVSMIATALLVSSCTSKQENAQMQSNDRSNIVNVSDYGAKGDGKTDDTDAIRKAVVSLAKSGNGSTLLFPKGKYILNILSYKEVDAAIAIDGIDNVTIDGQGSEFIPSCQKMNVISVKNSKGVTIRNLSICWDRPYFSQGKVVSSTANSMDVLVDANYPIDGTEKIEALMDYDPVSRMPIARFDLFGSAITKKELIAPQTLRLEIKSKWETPEKTKYVSSMLSSLPVDTLILLRHAIYGQYGMDINLCENVKIENVNIWGVPGMAIHMTQCKDTQINNLTVEPKPGTDRVMSTTGDAVFIMYPMGELLVENTRIEASGDDCLPINGKYLKVAEITDKSTMKMKVDVGWPGPVARPGDRIDFYGARDLLYLTTLTVDNGRFDAKEKCHIIKFREELPKTISIGDAAYNSAFTCNKITVRNTVLGANRSRATILSARNIEFDNVKIHDTGLAGAMVFGDAGRSHRPGPSVENMTFRKCIFDSCALSPLIVYTGAPAAGPAQKNINIIDCKFTENENLKKLRVKGSMYKNIIFYQIAIYFKDVDGGQITGNSFQGYDLSMFLSNTRNVSVKDNKCLDKIQSKIIIDQTTNKGLSLDGNKNFEQDADMSKYNSSYLYYTDMR